MKRVLSRCRMGVLATATVVVIALMVRLAAGTDDLVLHAKLVWGANSEKPRDPKVQPVDPETAKKLSKVFKWQSYYEVNRTNFIVTAGSKQKVTMSAKCNLEVEYLGNSNVELKLFGKGKMVVSKRQTISLGEIAVLAGPDENDTAWFVVLRREKR